MAIVPGAHGGRQGRSARSRRESIPRSSGRSQWKLKTGVRSDHSAGRRAPPPFPREPRLIRCRRASVCPALGRVRSIRLRCYACGAKERNNHQMLGDCWRSRRRRSRRTRRRPRPQRLAADRRSAPRQPEPCLRGTLGSDPSHPTLCRGDRMPSALPCHTRTACPASLSQATRSAATSASTPSITKVGSACSHPSRRAERQSLV